MTAASTAPPLSLAALTVLELSPPELVSCAAMAGYSHVGLRLVPATPEEASWPTVGDTPMTREIAARLADSGVAVLDIEILRLKPATDVHEYDAVLETGARLGARHALVAANDPDPARLAVNFAALAQRAATFGLALALEPMPWCDVRTLEQANALVEQSGVTNAGILIDAIHFDRARETPADIAAIPSARLPYMQLCDAPAQRPTDEATLLHQARAERLMPGDGGLDLVGLLAALPPGNPIALEVPMRTLAATLGAKERATRLLHKTRELLVRVADARATRSYA